MSALADNKKTSKSKFNEPRRSAFESNSFKTNGGAGGGGSKGSSPELPGGTGSGGSGGGNPIPISGGALLLAGGLITYTLLQKKYSKDA